jgi:hypothetical protein
MKSTLREHGVATTASSLPGNLGLLALAWNRIDIQATTFSVGYETKALLAPNIPGSFGSFKDAKDSLDVIAPNSKQALLGGSNYRAISLTERFSLASHQISAGLLSTPSSGSTSSKRNSR